jgi:hypothetical protein
MRLVKRIITAISFAALAGSALAGQQSGGFVRSPLDRPPPGILDPLEVRDPLMDSPSAGRSLPELPGGRDASRDFRDLQPRPLPGQRAPLDLSPRPYDPLPVAPR